VTLQREQHRNWRIGSGIKIQTIERLEVVPRARSKHSALEVAGIGINRRAGRRPLHSAAITQIAAARCSWPAMSSPFPTTVTARASQSDCQESESSGQIVRFGVAR